jgi:hypothetical protein
MHRCYECGAPRTRTRKVVRNDKEYTEYVCERCENIEKAHPELVAWIADVVRIATEKAFNEHELSCHESGDY